MKSKIWLSLPHMSGGEEKYINEAFSQNWVAPLGPNLNKFEQYIKDYLGGEVYVAGLSSGTAALHLGLILLDVKTGDEVICQSMTFAASANPIVYLGAKPIFIDSERDTLNLCPMTLEKAIKDRLQHGVKPKAIIAVHLYGMPYKHKEIKKISDKYNIPILEDSAEAFGSLYYGQRCGTLGDISILSFNGNKIITTSGGGALIAKKKETKEKAIFLATQARDNAPHYQHSHIGYNYRLSNICAGIGCGQMEVLDERVQQRRKNHLFYKEIFNSIPQASLLTEKDSNIFSNHWLSVVLLENFEQKEKLRLALKKENIESRPIWKPMHLQPIFSDALFYGDSTSENAFKRGLCLPSSSNLKKEDKNRIKNCILRNFLP